MSNTKKTALELLAEGYAKQPENQPKTNESSIKLREAETDLSVPYFLILKGYQKSKKSSEVPDNQQ